MNEIFISYSRKNKPFVQKLVDRLQQMERSTWIDWEDIPWTADWWREIREGIENSDNFVFVLSPESLRSVVCTLEVNHAIQNGKRVIPIVLEQADHSQALQEIIRTTMDESMLELLGGRDLVKLSRYNWRFLAQHNWMFFDDESKFDESVGNLLDAIDTDLHHIRNHTRLLVRAKEWDLQDHEPSFLLDGTEILEAEEWLSTAAGKEPLPTQLHTAYILSSRQQANRRQRRLLSGVSAALAITIMLAILSSILWRQAVFQEQRANRQAQISEAGRVALQGLLELGEQRLDSALLLGLEALQIVDSVEARSSLLTSLQSAPQLQQFVYAHDNWVRAVAYHPDGTQYATADATGNIMFWDAVTHEALAEPVNQQPRGIWELAYHPNGTILASVGGNGTIFLWDTKTQTPVGEAFANLQGDIFSAAFSPDGDVLATGHVDNLLRLWDWQTGEELAQLEAHTDMVSKVTFSPDGQLLASGGRDALIVVWDVVERDNPQVRYTLDAHDNWVFALDFNRDGTILASGSADNTVRLWDVATGGAIGQPLRDHLDWVRSVAFSPDGQVLVSASQDGRLILRNPSHGGRLHGVPPLTGHGDDIFSFAFSPDTQHMISGDQSGELLVWNIWQHQPFSQIIAEDEGEIYSVAYTPDGAQVLAGSTAGHATLWDFNTGETGAAQREAFAANSQVINVAISPDGEVLATAAADNTVVLRSRATGQIIATLSGFPALVRDLAFSPNSNLLATAGEDGLVTLWNTGDGTQNGETLNAEAGRMQALAFGSNGVYLAAGNADGNIFIWDVNARTLNTKLPQLHTRDITSLAFNPDGGILASGSRDNTVILWDTNSGEALGLPLQGHENWVLDVAFSPDGAVLASGSRDETIRLWDVATQQAIGQAFQSVNGWVWSLAFHPDGEVLVSGGSEGGLERWIMSLELWRERACAIANRSLSQIERERFLADTSFVPACL